MEAESTKWPPCCSSHSVSGMHHRVRKEINKERQKLEQASENVPTWHRGVAPSLPFMYPTFGAAPAPHMLTSTTVRGLKYMLSSLLGYHILSYEPPPDFVIPSFSMYDGSSDPYDHMPHFNQVMILNAGNDRLLCKVFSASLKGPALAWFHKLPWRSINPFNELWATFVSQYLCSVQQKGNISSLQTIVKREEESICNFTRRFRWAVQQIDSYSMDVVLQNFQISFRLTTPFFHSLSLDPPGIIEELY